MPPTSTRPRRIAIVGGGITGASAASILGPLGIQVSVFDQGRRGPGGRASHRSVRASDAAVLADDALPPSAATWEFDHGCQFFRADSARMQRICARWCELGWAAPYEGRFGRVGAAADFFGLPSSDAAPVYAGVGGMQRLPRAVLAASGAAVHAGVRVTGMARAADGTWSLRGVGGEAAFHDSSEAEAAAGVERPLGDFDAVLLTDISSSFEDWHRASAGVPEALARRVRGRARVPLFTCMVALRAPLGLPHDGIAFGGGGGGGAAPAVWWAARSQAKPGAPPAAAECWTLVSTPAFAAAEVSRVPMQDKASGAFRPQTDEYLNEGPGSALWSAFADAVRPLLPADAPPLPGPLYLQAQRWGSAFPAPALVGGRDADGRGDGTTTVLDVAYEADTPPLVYERPDAPATPADEPDRDFLVDDGLGLAYAGDYCSRRPPGFEAACLSGLEAAEHLASRLLGAELGVLAVGDNARGAAADQAAAPADDIAAAAPDRIYDEIPLADMEWVEDDGMYYYECPCGDMFELSKADFDAGKDIAKCPSCSLKIRVLRPPPE